MAATAIARSLPCCARRDGWSTTSGSSASAPRGAQSAGPAAQAGATMAERWIVPAAACRAPQSRVVPRFREGRLYDFVEDRTHDGRKFRMLNIVDEFTHECLAIRVARQLKATDVIDMLSDWTCFGKVESSR